MTFDDVQPARHRCRPTRFPLSLLSLALALSGCAIDPSPAPLPEPIRPPQQQQAYDANLKQGSVRDEQTLKAQRFQTTPGQVRTGPTYVEASADVLGQNLSGPAISLNLNNFPLPAFINEVFGNRLGLSFSVAPALQAKTDLVSLRLSDPQPPADLFATARFVLGDYGVAVTEREGVLYFQLADNSANDNLPLLVSGSALPDVPMSHRPVFQQIPMRVVRSDSMLVWLKDMFTGTSLQVSSDPLRNTIMLRGPIELIRQASSAVELFDQPALKGSHSLAISPVYSDAESLGSALVKVLQAEGYDVSENPPLGGVVVLKLKELQRLIVFAADPAILTTARHWVELLDRQSQEQVENGLFVYQVRNTQAAGIATMLGALGYSATIPATGLNDSNTSSATGERLGSLTAGNTQASRGVSTGGSSPTTIEGRPEQGNVVVDANRNAIIYKGSGQQWLQLRPLLEELDRPVPSVMIDVLLAEVNINDREGLGIDWRNITASLGGRELLIGTANGLGASGLNISALNSAGQTKAALNAFYENRQAVIRSSPKLMVRSGQEARIEVGNEIPVVTGTTQSTETGSAPITQTVQYRKTGVLLSIKPTVQASGVVDLQVSQELSESTDTSTGENLTPVINNRKVETTLTLRDGGSVMLAGLISSNKGRGDTGVPLLGDLPWVGNLFKSQSASENRTELIVMIIPYIIRDFDEAQALTRSYQERLPLNSAPTLERRGLNRLPEVNPNPPVSP